MILEKIDFPKTESEIKQLFEEYNFDKKNCDKLKPVHFQLLKELIRQYNSQRYSAPSHTGENMDVIMPTNFPIATNNVILGDRLGGYNKSTIYRQMSRLKVAGFLNKIYHGPEANYEIIFKKNFVFFLSSQTAVNQYRIAKSNPSSFLKKNYININNTCSKDTILKGAKADSKKNLEKDTIKDTAASYQNHAQNTRTIGEIIGELTGISPKKSDTSTSSGENPQITNKIAEKNQKIENYKRSAATSIVTTYIDEVIPEKNVYPDEKNNAINYVYQHYYSQLSQFSTVNKTYFEHKMRIGFAAKRKIKVPEYFGPFPMKYFDVNNENNSFNITEIWLKKSQKWKEYKEKRRKKLIREQKYLKALNYYINNKTIDAYRRSENYIKSNLPEMLENFYKSV